MNNFLSSSAPFLRAAADSDPDDPRRPRRRHARVMKKMCYLLQNGFHELLQRIFSVVGKTIATRPFLFLLIPLLFSTVSYGVVNLKFAQKLQDGFTTTDAPSHYEEQIAVQFQGNSWGFTQRCAVLVRARDEGSMLRRGHLKRAHQLHRFLRDNFTVTVEDGRSYRHGQVCGSYCEINKAFDMIEKSQEILESEYRQSGHVREDIVIDHPKATFEGYRYSVALHLFGVTKRWNTSATPIDMDDVGNRLEHVAMVMMLFYAEAPDANTTNILATWESELYEWVRRGTPEFPEFHIDLMGDQILGKEMVRGGLSLLPHLLMGLFSTIVFVLATVLGSSVQSTALPFTGKILIVAGIVLSPLLAVFTTFGIMGFFHIELYPIQMVIPFLILAIGVDDAFLMVHAWNRLSSEYAHLSPSERRSCIPEIMGKVLEEVGPSITITSLTNAIAFGVGTTVSTHAIQLFCMAATIAMVVDFLYELTLFGCILVFSARLERLPSCDTANKKVTCKGEKAEFPEKSVQLLTDSLKRYCSLLTKRSMRVAVLLFAFGFFLLSLWGTLRIRTHINSQKIIPSDSLLLRTDTLFERYQWKEYEALQVFVNNPPDIKDSGAISELKRMVHEFETLPQAIGPDATVFWLSDYEEYVSHMSQLSALVGIESEVSYNDIPEFLDVLPFWKNTFKWHRTENNSIAVSQYYFITGYCNLTSWLQRAELMLKWREVASRWGRFNVTIYSENAPVFEGIFGLKHTTIQTAAITLVCMLVVCVVFVPSVAGVLSAGFAIASISLGVFGFLCWWGLDLDPVTMSAIVMSIGFSVDYTAHVSYHYHRAKQLLPRETPKEELLYYTLEAVAWPMLQAALSTIVCFVPVAFHPDYTPTVFVKTIFLVVSLGVLHGLLILPVVLTILPDSLYSDVRRPSKPTTHEPLFVKKHRRAHSTLSSAMQHHREPLLLDFAVPKPPAPSPSTATTSTALTAVAELPSEASATSSE
ncbi:hypothetical protein QR680_017817 [Steinernema hermaphroditum]|uniref:SSD domain-containing protein n=1 Tax=Steinernema hermaphroditum TaxID=289476 RepID=A0AA39LPT3_9BILA|nr:hypothetical protein QR680_017817 [Steinernema hermaphroditum]